MFFGRYEHSIDEKGRITIPARYRELLEHGAYVTQGFDQNLMVMTAATFEALYQRINQMSLTDPVARSLRRQIFSNAALLEQDKAGRFLIPGYLRDLVHLDGAAVVVGAGSYFEIWAPEQWKVQAEQQDPSLAEKFAALDISLR